MDNYSGYNIDFVINPKNYLLKNKLKENHASFENEPYDLFVKDGYDERIKRNLLIKAIQLNNKKIMLLTDVNDIDSTNLYKSVGFIIVENQK